MKINLFRIKKVRTARAVYCLILFIYSSVNCFGQPSPEGEKYFKTAQEFLQKNEYQKAIDNFTLALNFIPSGENIYYLRGLARHQLGNYTTAITDFNMAVNLNKNVAVFYNARAWTNCFTGEYVKAIADADKAISLEKNGEYYDTRATAYGLRLLFIVAISDFNEALKLKPKALYFYKRGLVKKANNDFSGAELDFTQARKLDPTESFKKEKDPFFTAQNIFNNSKQQTIAATTTTTKQAFIHLLKEDQFSILFPGKPEIRRESNSNFSKAITAKYNAGSKMYYFGYRVLDKNYFSGLPWGEILYELRNLYAESIGASVSEVSHFKEKETYEGDEGVTYKLSKPGVYALFKDIGVLKKGYKLYRIGLIFSDRYPTQDELNEFYKGFKMTY